MVTHRRSTEGPAYLASGFTLVELMVVVLIIGILVTIAVPVYTRARLDAEGKACQANQRIIEEAIETARSADESFASASAGLFTEDASGWYGILVPGWIKSKPVCPLEQDDYLMSESGDILGDSNSDPTFKPNHEAP